MEQQTFFVPTAEDIFLQKKAVLGSGGSRMGGRTLLALVSKWIKFQNTRISRIRPNLIFCIRPNLMFCIRPHRISGVAGFQISRISDKIPIRCTSLDSERMLVNPQHPIFSCLFMHGTSGL